MGQKKQQEQEKHIIIRIGTISSFLLPRSTRRKKRSTRGEGRGKNYPSISFSSLFPSGFSPPLLALAWPALLLAWLSSAAMVDGLLLFGRTVAGPGGPANYLLILLAFLSPPPSSPCLLSPSIHCLSRIWPGEAMGGRGGGNWMERCPAALKNGGKAGGRRGEGREGRYLIGRQWWPSPPLPPTIIFAVLLSKASSASSPFRLAHT